MAANTTALSLRPFSLATWRRATLSLLLAAFAITGTAASGFSPAFMLMLALGLAAAVAAARYPWFSAALPMIAFSLVGTDLAAGVRLAGVNINAIDVIIFPSLLLLAGRILTGTRRVPRPGLAALMLAAWIALTTLAGLIHASPPALLRNELHVFLFLPLAYLWVTTEITSKRMLWLLLVAIITSTVLAGAKALIITFFIDHPHAGISYVWQAWTDASDSVGGQRTRLNGADTMFVLAPPFLAAAALFAPRCRSAWFLLAGSPFVVFGLLTSVTRTYWAVATASVLLVLLLGVIGAGRRTAMKATTLATIMVVAQVTMVVFFTQGLSNADFGQILIERVQTNNFVAVDQNLDYRQTEAGVFLDAARRHIVWGAGLGAAVTFKDMAALTNDVVASPSTTITTRDGHNGLLEILFKSGLVGLSLFLLATGITSWRAVSGYLSTNDKLLKMVLLGTGLALPSLLTASITVNRLSHFEGAFFIGLAVAIVEIARRLPEDTAALPEAGSKPFKAAV